MSGGLFDRMYYSAQWKKWADKVIKSLLSSIGYKVDKVTGSSLVSDTEITRLANVITSNDVLVDAASITKHLSVKAAKDYMDSIAVGLLDYRGVFDASVNTYPTTGGSGALGAILKGDMWIVSVGGTIDGVVVHPGNSIIASVDTPAQLTANWNMIDSDLGYTAEDIVNKSTSVATDAASDVKYPSVKAVVTYAEALTDKSQSIAIDAASAIKYPSVIAVKTYTDGAHAAISPLSKFTPEGGLAIRMLNKTGVASVKGTPVVASTTTDNAFSAQTNTYDTFGMVYEDGIVDGQLCWVVVAGIAEVLYKNATASTRGHVLIADAVDGRCSDIVVPTGDPIIPSHFAECGHVLETKVGGVNVLVKCVIHFN
jgi:hypothetical protein